MGPLSGIKIVEIKGLGPGPYAGQLMADLGAEVIVVERASRPNSIAPPSAMDVNSRGKRSIALNLKTNEGLEALLKLVEQADVLFESNRPGTAERFGFGPDSCLARNPALVYGRVTGWGQNGPLAHTAGHDYNYISLTGAAAAIGSQHQPQPPLNLVGDYAGGSLFLVMGILAALLEVQRSGKGQVVDAAVTDGSAHLMSVFYTLSQMGGWCPEREKNLLDGGAPFYAAYETLDHKHVSVAALEPHFFKELITKAGMPVDYLQRQYDSTGWPDMKACFAETFKSKTRSEWVALFEGSDACVTGIFDYQEAVEHPHNKARNTFVTLNGHAQPAPAPRFSRTRCRTPVAPSSEGADTRDVLLEWGFDEHDIARLDESGALS